MLHDSWTRIQCIWTAAETILLPSTLWGFMISFSALLSQTNWYVFSGFLGFVWPWVVCFTLLQAFLCWIVDILMYNCCVCQLRWGVCSQFCIRLALLWWPTSLSTWGKTEGATYHVSKYYLISCGCPETCILCTVHVLSANLSRAFIVMIHLVLSLDGEGVHCLCRVESTRLLQTSYTLLGIAH